MMAIDQLRIFAWIYKHAVAVMMEGKTIKEITDDFVGCYTTENDYLGGFSRIVATGNLPDGVDGDDPRVKIIIERCRQRVSAFRG
jgi:hypothetical protein